MSDRPGGPTLDRDRFTYMSPSTISLILALLAAAVAVGVFVYWVAAREAAVAFEDLPPVDAAVMGIVEGHQAGDFRKRERERGAG